MQDKSDVSLIHDPIHGYIPFVSRASGETAERELIDHPWLQRLRQIHQLQTAWWVYPTAEHTRFQHVVGAMHMASRATAALYDSLAHVCPDVPSRGCVECLLRMAALLHDVGHGPFGHFFDEHFLRPFGLTHETLGSRIIIGELSPLLRGVRRSPDGRLERGEELDPAQVAFLITRPRPGEQGGQPRWLVFLRSLFCGLYTVDNMDFVLRDAFMSGYSPQAFDVARLLHYSFFSEQGLTIHRRGVDALVRFIRVRGELFRAIYFHRTVRAIDLTLADLFAESRELLFPGNPLEHLAEYQRFTEWSLLVDVARWHESADRSRRRLAPGWQALLARQVQWQTITERNVLFATTAGEAASVFADRESVHARLIKKLPGRLAEAPLRVDLARYIHRPDTQGAATGQNFLYSPARKQVRPLTDDQLFHQMPLAGRVCRVYARQDAPEELAPAVEAALDEMLGGSTVDDLTNM